MADSFWIPVSNHYHRMPRGSWTSPLAHPSRDHVQTSALLGFGRTRCLQRSVGVLKSCPWESVHYHDCVSVRFFWCKISIFPLDFGDLHRFYLGGSWRSKISVSMCFIHHTKWPLKAEIQQLRLSERSDSYPSYHFTKKVLWGPAAAIIDHWIRLIIHAHFWDSFRPYEPLEVCASMQVLLEDRCSNMKFKAK